ncbi:hypothetical protein NUW54_g4311 [Trametes sanguinea]|uniref:Uncharacterized protein n=1 Tax=Trametes sanguinea TaxID=158606 RepID=A0ACC1PYB0_9APHY|nr:hypothetical protein NUW54_g4311 [Trametes sanguinea]
MQAKPARLIGQSPQSTAHHPSTRSPRASTSSSPLFIDIHSMTSRLPLELWEAVLDHCALPTQVDIRNRSFFISEISRKRPKLLRRLCCARSPNDVDRLCDILTRRPHLAAFVRILSIAPTGPQPRPSRADFQFHVVPFARPQLTQHLNNLHSIVYIGSPWTEWPYPTAYNFPIAQYGSLKTLHLSTAFSRPVDIFATSDGDDRLDPGYRQLKSLATRKPRYTFLEILLISVSNLSVYLRAQHAASIARWRSLPFGLDADGQLFPQCEKFSSPSFPLEDVFGTSATRVALSRQRDWAPESTGELRSIRYVSSLPSLQEVDLVFECTFSPDVPAALSFVKDSVLSWMRPGHSFRRICIEFQLDVAFNNVPNLHDVSFILEFRDSLLTPVEKAKDLSPEYRATLDQLGLDSDHDRPRSWFEQTIRDALPKLQANLTVTIGEGDVWPKC